MSKVRNISKDAGPARERLPEVMKLMKKYFGKFDKVGKKQIYLIDNNGKPFYVWVLSAPSNLQFDSSIRGVMRKCGKYPLYAMFSRDPNTYPRTAGNTYWAKIKSVYKTTTGTFRGAIMGLEHFDKIIAQQMKDNAKIKLDYNRYASITKDTMTMEQVLRELAGLTPKKLKAIMPILKLINQ